MGTLDCCFAIATHTKQRIYPVELSDFVVNPYITAMSWSHWNEIYMCSEYETIDPSSIIQKV